MKGIIIPEDEDRIKEVLFKELSEDAYESIERLGGLTNHTYRVVLKNGNAYAVRIPGQGTESLINRKNERISTELACKIGVDAPLVCFYDSGEKITHYIHGAETMSPDKIKHEAILGKIAHILHKLHSCGENTGVLFDVFNMANTYENIIVENNVPLFPDYEQVKETIIRIKSSIGASRSHLLVPCHNDPLCENWVLDDRNRLYLIDWEYAGMNDGMWDLADVSIEAELSPEEDNILIRSYFNGAASEDELKRFQANKLYLDFLWALWGKARVPFDGDEMERYAEMRYTRLKQNINKFASFIL